MTPRNHVPYEKLSQYFDYCPLTGVVFKKKPKYREVGFVHKGYKVVNYPGRKNIRLYAHRVAWCLYYRTDNIPNVIDHIGRNPLNNRIDNLRASSDFLNQINRARGKTGYMGVRHNKWGSFEARTRFKGKRIHIGTFKTAEEAYDAYLAKRRELHGDYI